MTNWRYAVWNIFFFYIFADAMNRVPTKKFIRLCVIRDFYVHLPSNYIYYMAIQITYRRTRRLSMRIVKNGDVHVSAPIGVSRSMVEDFIERHRDWIAEARKKNLERQKNGN